MKKNLIQQFKCDHAVNIERKHLHTLLKLINFKSRNYYFEFIINQITYKVLCNICCYILYHFSYFILILFRMIKTTIN